MSLINFIDIRHGTKRFDRLCSIRPFGEESIGVTESRSVDIMIGLGASILHHFHLTHTTSIRHDFVFVVLMYSLGCKHSIAWSK